ncbi:MAG TPA: sarcosine oxidase subunit delta [Candidatus Dormibacteraeota bacterium]|nr:sarcosine oxidase subunit delta [Candidatus Dormibacteraeota bacterium]
MFVPCPWCGERGDAEFKYGGAAGVAYPVDPEATDDSEWARYLFHRPNPKGPFRERWYHSAGCRRWFTVTRDTVTHRIDT